ncbi:MAG: Ldh family oxidoreductase [Caldilineaceae bacterium]|nr:Ldh family oxidoreductase [Caldilineaceae bacterium]
MPILSVEALRSFTLDVLEKLGTPPEYAQIVCNSLVGANLVGHDSHGVLRLTSYARLVDEGKIVPAATPIVDWRNRAAAHVDGHWGWGPVGARLGTETALALAAEFGIAAVTVDRCAHIGRIGEYVALMAEAGMVGMALCNHYPAVAPFGGRERIFGTNPVALATPGGPNRPPILVDFATSGVAEGKLRVARAKGETVAPGLIVDSDGHPSQTPGDFYAGGALLPFGAHKGYGLGLMVEILGGLLSGAGISALPGFEGANGTLLVAIDIAHFAPTETFARQAGALAQHISASKPAAGFERVLVPGEPEHNTYAHRNAHGIPIPDTTWSELQELQRSLTR